MNIIIRTGSVDNKNEIKKQLEENHILNYTDDNLFSDMLYLYRINDIIITEFSYIISTEFEQVTIDKNLTNYLSIHNEKD